MTSAPHAIILSEPPAADARAIFDAFPAGQPERLAPTEIWKRQGGRSHVEPA